LEPWAVDNRRSPARAPSGANSDARGWGDRKSNPLYAFPTARCCLSLHPDDAAAHLSDALARPPGGKIGEYMLDANDTFVVTAELQNGAVGALQATRFATGNANELRISIYGDKGALMLWTNGPITTFSPPRALWMNWPKRRASIRWSFVCVT
jgi:predicted dehydrogenase